MVVNWEKNFTWWYCYAEPVKAKHFLQVGAPITNLWHARFLFLLDETLRKRDKSNYHTE